VCYEKQQIHSFSKQRELTLRLFVTISFHFRLNLRFFSVNAFSTSYHCMSLIMKVFPPQSFCQKDPPGTYDRLYDQSWTL